MSAEEFRVLVQLHNIANLPKELAVGSTKVFSVVVTYNNAISSGATAPEVTSTFNTTTDVTVNDRLEAKLEGKAEWTSPNPSFEVIVTIYENNVEGGGYGSTSSVNPTSGTVVAISQPTLINARDVIEVKKISTRIIGTSMGQVGISFSVSPNDVDGYTRRLEQLLLKYNPQGAALVPQVVKAHGEVEAFTKVFKKYGLVDYNRRFQEYFELYGRDFLPQVPTILSEWENREEELMRNLILDNGPELSDVDIKKRLVAFAEKYDIRDLDADKIAASGRLPQEVMAALVQRYGPEPDPRTYCFPTVFYNAAQISGHNSRAPSPYVTTTSGRPPVSSQPMASNANPPTSMYNNTISQSVGRNPYSQSPMHGNSNQTFQSNQTSGGHPTAQHAASPYSGSAQLLGAGSGSSLMSATPSTSSPHLVELWSKLMEDLRTSNVPLSELHYVNEGSFEALLIELGYPAHIRAQLSAEWLRRVRSALRQEPLTAGDSLYEAARRDILSIGNLLPLNVSVVGVVSVKNSEHESSFSLRLGDAKVRATERMLLVGDYTKLLNISVHGICPTPQRSAPAAIFYRNPLSVFHKPTSVSILVCDVVVGKPQVISEVTSTPYDATLEFLQNYDSCVFTDPVYGRAVAVYAPQQVLPRYIVHANVDNSITPCPANPERPVEYLVVENNAFACSQCVVMGQYRGKEVIPIDEAATQARTQLSEMHRNAEGLVHELSTEEEVCAKTIDGINNGEIRSNALKIADQIRREAEQKIQQLMLEAEDLERTQLQAVSQQKARVHAVLVDAKQVSQMLQEKATRSATSAIEALLQLKNNSPIAPIRQRAQGVLAQQQAVHELNNNNAAGLVGVFTSLGGNHSNNIGLNTTFAGGQQQQHINATGTTNNTTMIGNQNAGPVFDTTNAGRYAPNTNTNAFGTAAAGARGQSSMAEHRAASLFRNNNSAQPADQQLNSNAANNFANATNMMSSTNSANQVVNGDLFSKYMALKNDQSSMNRGTNSNVNTSTTFPPPPNQNQSALQGRTGSIAPAAGGASSPPPSNNLSAAEAKRNKEQMTKGWSEYRRGDRTAALTTWSDVYERNSTNSTGARAKAYIAEAIERDYDAASRWYEKAISLDPTDVMSLYNYGVLLESVLNRKREAMQLFETAYRYGDQTAGKRAQQLRVQLGL